MSTKKCRHHRVNWVVGPRLPLRYGSATTIVCSECGAWRDERVAKPEWRNPRELLLATCERDDDGFKIPYQGPLLAPGDRAGD